MAYKTLHKKSLSTVLKIILTGLISGCAADPIGLTQIDNTARTCIKYEISNFNTAELQETGEVIPLDGCLQNGYFVVEPKTVRLLRVRYLELKKKYEKRCGK